MDDTKSSLESIIRVAGAIMSELRVRWRTSRENDERGTGERRWICKSREDFSLEMLVLMGISQSVYKAPSVGRVSDCVMPETLTAITQ